MAGGAEDLPELERVRREVREDGERAALELEQVGGVGGHDAQACQIGRRAVGEGRRRAGAGHRAGLGRARPSARG
ncbi:hypothetical protein CCE01nite_12580 [Cellulomonas cellasea]|uniref:Uncharacterized protein n=1 Tax=Cellulomonas cellasea TaxID=43670 RepID=A0A4Y3KSA2_9CELL|nr:hypothetical protein CCE01nite_12580 [Cellulomonas cellasea]